MEIIISVVAKISDYTVAPLGRQLGYLLSYTTNVQNLTTQKEKLTCARARLQHSIDVATNDCEEILPDVESWLKNVDQITRRFDTFYNDEGHAKAKCSSCGSVLHLVTRHQLSRIAKKMSADICELLERSTFDPISYPCQIESSFATIAKDYENFDSRKAILEDIMTAVRDPNRSRIGFWGMGGIGKTMLVKKIARKVEEENLFSKVVMTVVSETPNIKYIQQEIAGRLDLRLDQTDSVQIRADKLRMRFKRDKSKILLILDDVWKKLDLEIIGIPDGCKMLFTSRFKDALRNYMGIAENNVFKIEALNSEEAINLFKTIIADIRVEQPDYKKLARKIVRECAGLPISIATMAHALKSHMELYTWKYALQQLQNSTFTGIDGMHEKVYSSIRISYDFLGRDEEAKSLLLLCALHKEDAEIEVEDLMRCSMGCSFLQNIDTVSEARDRVNSLVDKLKSHCLLLDGKSKCYVKMHDVIRDVCISIAKEDSHKMTNITRASMYEKFVKEEKNKESKAISFLSYDDFRNLPPKLECPSLELLLLNSGWSSEAFPNDFFGQTRKLEALHMKGNFCKLPSSFQSLQNLQTLCVHGTYLEDIAVIGELKSLKVLDLSSSNFIKLLPEEIGQLRRLQLLDLRKCDGLKVIKPNVISNLTQMEELYMPAQFKGWETKKGSMEERKKASVEEIKSLQRLTILYLSIPSIKDCPNDLFTEKLETFQISIGSTYDSCNFPDELKTSRLLHLILSNLDEINTLGLNSLIIRSEYLLIEGLDDVTNVVHDLDEDGFPTLKNMELQQLPLLEGICHGNLPACTFNKLRKEWLPNLPENTTLLAKLETIKLSKLPAFKTFCSEQVSIGDDEGKIIPIPKYAFNGMIAFFNLKKLNVSYCHNFKYLLSFDMARSLVQLEELDITKCVNIEEVIASDEESGGSKSVIFKKLQILKLFDLPNLVKFWEGDCIQCPLLLKLVIMCCPKALEFISSNSIGKKECPLSEEMGMVAASKQSFFKDQIVFSSLKKLKIMGCDNLKYIISFVMVRRLVQLEELEIWSCENIEEVIASDEESGESISITFEKLQTLQLLNLPNLVKFWEGDCIKCPLLSTLDIRGCPKVLEFISSNSMGKKECPLSQEKGMLAASKQSFFKDKIEFPNLKELTVTIGEEFEMVAVPEQRLFNDKVNFPNLQTLKTDWSEGIFEMSSQSSSTISTFPNLSQLDITCFSPNKSIAVSDVEFFLHKYHNIHTLGLRGSSFVDGHQQPQPAHNELSNTTTSTSLMHLRISKANGVNHLFEGLSHSILFQNLKSLSIEYCIRLENIPPLFMAFHKLETLKIYGCDRLTYLLGSSTAASLPQLKLLEICNCKGMRVVISDDEQRQPEPLTQLVFHTLHTLNLEYLPNLESFYSGDKVISFPNLNKINVDGKNVGMRDGDVNKTIRHLFTQQKDDDDDDDDDDEVSSIGTRSQGQLRTCESSRGSCSKA